MNICSYRPLKFFTDTQGLNERFKTLFDATCYLRGQSGSSLTADLPLDITAGVISIPQADTNNDGYLTTGDWDTFNLKWGPNGNQALGGDFLGTTNGQDLRIRTNNTFVASISGDANYRYNFSPNTLGHTGAYNFIFGYQPSTSNNYTLSGGFQTIASGLVSVALNRNTTASGSYSFACCSSSVASGQGTFAANNCTIKTFFGAGFGLYNEIATDTSTTAAIAADNRIFVIGNGSGFSHKHNALTVLHGSDLVDGTDPKFGFNELAPTDTVHINGSFRLVSGNEGNNKVLVSDANGVGDWVTTLGYASGGTGNSAAPTNGYVAVGDGTKYVPTDPTTLFPILADGEYTPTGTNDVNLDSHAEYTCQYLRVGSRVTVSGKITLKATGVASDTSIDLDLPIATTFAATEEAGGAGWSSSIAGGGLSIEAVPATSTVKLAFISVDLGVAHDYYFSFTYKII